MVQSLSKKSNSQNLLTQLITDNQIIKEVQTLDAEIVKKIIHHVGLEDSAEFLMLITSEQMQEVMDQDTWMSSKVGEDEKLDAKRFCTWIEVLMEVGSDFAAEKISEMDEDLLTAVLAQMIMAIDSDELALMTRSSEDDYHSENKYLEKALESTFSLEAEGYHVMSKETFHWDTISNLFSCLEKDHRDLTERILARISSITLGQIDEFDGLYNLLKESDMLDNDVSTDRQDRREKDGYVAPSSASAFLKLADQSLEPDHISKMYFRSFKPSKSKMVTPLSAELMGILKTHGVKVSTPKMKLLSEAPTTSPTQKYLRSLREGNIEVFQQKLLELNFLSNVLLSGYTDRKRRLRPVEAMDMALRFCDQGFEYSEADAAGVSQDDLLKLFKLGWQNRMKS